MERVDMAGNKVDNKERMEDIAEEVYAADPSEVDFVVALIDQQLH
ncbi:MAG: hypothetical protein PHE93_04530 [Clostridia bacterium]|nr:hypothetical protein [Clostridia bacterium]